jgi:hypothetical protein
VTPSIQKKIRLGTGGKRRFPRQARRTPTPIVTVGTTVINDRDDRPLMSSTSWRSSRAQYRVVEAGKAKLRELDAGDLSRLERITTMLR